MTLTKEIRDNAEITKHMTIEEAKKEPGINGFIIPGNLQENGFHAFTMNNSDGTKTKTLIIKA